MRAEDPTAHDTHILPVLMFDVGGKEDSDAALLLDGLHKAVAFSDMVIAVRLEASGGSGWQQSVRAGDKRCVHEVVWDMGTRQSHILTWSLR